MVGITSGGRKRGVRSRNKRRDFLICIIMRGNRKACLRRHFSSGHSRFSDIHQILDVSFRSADRRIVQPQRLESLCGRIGKRRADDLLMDCRIAGSRTTPFLPTFSRPASNCGLIRQTISAPGFMISKAAGRIFESEMKETSQEAKSGTGSFPSCVSSSRVR